MHQTRSVRPEPQVSETDNRQVREEAGEAEAERRGGRMEESMERCWGPSTKSEQVMWF